jgi:hypothetical protein
VRPRESGGAGGYAPCAEISRLTLDGAGKASVCLAYGDAFSTDNENSDLLVSAGEGGRETVLIAGKGETCTK